MLNNVQIQLHADTVLDEVKRLSAAIKPPFDQALMDDEQRDLLENLVSQLRLFSRLLKPVLLELRADNVNA